MMLRGSPAVAVAAMGAALAGCMFANVTDVAAIPPSALQARVDAVPAKDPTP